MAQVKSVTALPDGNVIIAYTDNKTVKKSSLEAAGEIATAKLSGAYQVSPNTPNTGGAAFGSTPSTGGSTNNVTVTPENLTAYYQQALSSKADGYAKIRTALLGAGLISKGTKSLTSVQNAWLSVLQGASQDGLDPYSYIAKIKKTGAGLDTTASTAPEPYAQTTIWDPTKATAVITDQYQTLLHRQPTPEELAKDIADLKAEQKKATSASKTTYKKVNGVTQAVTTGGLDEAQWFANKLQGTEEYKKLQTDLNSTAVQQLKGIAADNGINLTDTQMVDWAKRLAGGESPEIFKTAIRGIAKLGQPESVKTLLDQGVDLATVYQPYKQTMAQILEVNPNTITLDDPVLRSAIKPEGEMSVYDFQRTLRKDPRWQYTNNARSEAADVATQVLKDFGFQG